jgi:UDP-N-acetylmuramoyl-tripeptide--D-alanyl-D-alanine ligase
MNAKLSLSFPHSHRISKPRYSYSRPHNKHKLPTFHSSIRVLGLATQNALNPTNCCPQNAHHDPGNSPLFFWTATEIAEAVNGRIVKWGPPGTICTDTRTLEPNQWFFAIAGQNFDAHDFVNPELSEKGCLGVIGNRVCENWDKGFVEINGDTVDSLMKMANYARNRFNGAVVGVTGSVGKTTTKSMIALALDSPGNQVYRSPGNWNTTIGVALSLIGIPRNAGVVILEMGMSRRGEILELARMARPSIRVILNVGASHLENFASLEEVAMAKGEILVDAKPGDVCVLNADDPLVMSLPIPYGVKKVSELGKYLF